MIAVGIIPPAFVLSGCALKKTCPEDPADSAGVDWTPGILHPMFWGFQELGTANGAPGHYASSIRPSIARHRTDAS